MTRASERRRRNATARRDGRSAETAPLPGNSLIGRFLDRIWFVREPDEINDQLITPQLAPNRAELGSGVRDNDDVDLTENVVDRVAHHRPDVWNLALDVLSVRAENSCPRDFAIVHGN